MQSYAMDGKKGSAILGPPARSGHVSVYAQKLTALSFVWLCSLVVWGHTANLGAAYRSCQSSCRFQIVFGVLIWLFSTMLLLLNYLCERGSMSRSGFFSHALEGQLVGVMALLWIPLVASVSALESVDRTGTDTLIGKSDAVSVWFAWLGFFGSVYGAFKAYHSFKEQDLPSPVPTGFDEEDYVYG